MKHTCTVCNKEGEWDEKWSQYGSILIEETQPEDIIKVCCDTCMSILNTKLKIKDIRLPVIKSYGPNNYKVIKERLGY
jgi:hypothetical protein